VVTGYRRSKKMSDSDWEKTRVRLEAELERHLGEPLMAHYYQNEVDALRARLAALEPLCRAAVGVDYDGATHRPPANGWDSNAVIIQARIWARSPEGRAFAKGIK
jgi:hypothetical protein